MQKVKDRRNGSNIVWIRTLLMDSCTFEQLKDIQEAQSNPALQDNVLLPEVFTVSIYHVGSGKELMSKVNHGLIPGGVSRKTGRHAVFFFTCESDG